MCVRIVFLNLGWLQLNGFIKSWPNKITAFGIILSVMKVYKFKTIQVQLTTVQLNQKKLVAKYLWLSYCFFYYKEMLIFRNLWSRKESSSGFASTSSSNARSWPASSTSKRPAGWESRVKVCHQIRIRIVERAQVGQNF